MTYGDLILFLQKLPQEVLNQSVDIKDINKLVRYGFIKAEVSDDGSVTILVD